MYESNDYIGTFSLFLLVIMNAGIRKSVSGIAGHLQIAYGASVFAECLIANTSVVFEYVGLKRNVLSGSMELRAPCIKMGVCSEALQFGHCICSNL